MPGNGLHRWLMVINTATNLPNAPAIYIIVRVRQDADQIDLSIRGCDLNHSMRGAFTHAPGLPIAHIAKMSAALMIRKTARLYQRGSCGIGADSSRMASSSGIVKACLDAKRPRSE